MALCDYLKAETAELHAIVERSRVNRLLFSATLDRKTYGHILGCYYNAFDEIETALSDLSLPGCLGYPKRQALLLEELKEFGESPQNQNKAGFSLMSEEEALGSLYVLQGSLSGAPFIEKRLKDTLFSNTDAPTSLRFFSAHNHPPFKASWPVFRKAIDDYAQSFDESQKEAALTGAKKTFKTFLHHFG